MQIITRAEAKAAKLNKYFTGKACRNGHIDERYTTSGTCATCIKMSAAKPVGNISRDRINELQQFAANRNEAKAQISEIKVRAYPRDLVTLRNLASTLMRLRWPFMRPEDAWSNHNGSDGAGGTLLYRLKAHPEDAVAIQTTAVGLIQQNGIDIAAERARIFGQVQREAEAAVEEPEWRP